ncbi:MAG: hypothetical protein K2X76_01560 [Sphingomonas sp.]|nr:hypothetical protein [Sphingomonas sp.]
MAAPPDPILQFFLKTFYKKTIDPKSDYYLPKLVQQQTNPVVEPYVLGGDWRQLDIGAQAANGAQLICAGTSPPSKTLFGIPSGDATPVLDLVRKSEVTFPEAVPFQLVGISNMLANPPLVTDGDNIAASARLGAVKDWPFKAFQIQGNFSIDQRCCQSADGTSCVSGTQYAPHGEGVFVATFAKATANVWASATVSPNGESLTVTINQLSFVADPDDLSIVVTIYSIGNPKWRDTYSKTAQQIFEDVTTKKSIISQISETLNAPNIRASFQQVVNNALSNLFG